MGLCIVIGRAKRVRMAIGSRQHTQKNNQSEDIHAKQLLTAIIILSKTILCQPWAFFSTHGAFNCFQRIIIIIANDVFRPAAKGQFMTVSKSWTRGQTSRCLTWPVPRSTDMSWPRFYLFTSRSSTVTLTIWSGHWLAFVFLLQSFFNLF